jgi:hypothetical protein
VAHPHAPGWAAVFSERPSDRGPPRRDRSNKTTDLPGRHSSYRIMIGAGSDTPGIYTAPCRLRRRRLVLPGWAAGVFDRSSSWLPSLHHVLHRLAYQLPAGPLGERITAAPLMVPGMGGRDGGKRPQGDISNRRNPGGEGVKYDKRDSGGLVSRSRRAEWGSARARLISGNFATYGLTRPNRFWIL